MSDITERPSASITGSGLTSDLGTSRVATIIHGEPTGFRYLDAWEIPERDFNVVTRGGQSNNSQRWVLTDTGGALYTIMQVSSNRYLDAHEIESLDFRVVTRPPAGQRHAALAHPPRCGPRGRPPGEQRPGPAAVLDRGQGLPARGQRVVVLQEAELSADQDREAAGPRRCRGRERVQGGSGLARLAPAVPRPACQGVNRVAEDGRGLDAPPGPGRADHQAPQRVTRQDKTAPKFPDLIRRDFTACRMNQKWVGDITEIPTAAGKLYQATVIDLYSRRLLGAATSRTYRANERWT